MVQAYFFLAYFLPINNIINNRALTNPRINYFNIDIDATTNMQPHAKIGSISFVSLDRNTYGYEIHLSRTI